MMHDKLLIDGKLEAGQGTALAVFNPATGEKIARIPQADLHQVDAAVRAAESAFAQWGQTTPKTRSLLLLELVDAIEQHAETFARIESLNCGKPYHAVLNDELPAVADVFRFFAGAARCLIG